MFFNDTMYSQQQIKLTQIFMLSHYRVPQKVFALTLTK